MPAEVRPCTLSLSDVFAASPITHGSARLALLDLGGHVSSNSRCCAFPTVQLGSRFLQFDPSELKSCYSMMTTAILPRPIAFVSTCGGPGMDNLAPYSYFNLVCHQPPTIAIGIMRHGRGPREKVRIGSAWCDLEVAPSFVHVRSQSMSGDTVATWPSSTRHIDLSTFAVLIAPPRPSPLHNPAPTLDTSLPLFLARFRITHQLKPPLSPPAERHVGQYRGHGRVHGQSLTSHIDLNVRGADTVDNPLHPFPPCVFHNPSAQPSVTPCRRTPGPTSRIRASSRSVAYKSY